MNVCSGFVCPQTPRHAAGHCGRSPQCRCQACSRPYSECMASREPQAVEAGERCEHEWERAGGGRFRCVKCRGWNIGADYVPPQLAPAAGTIYVGVEAGEASVYSGHYPRNSKVYVDNLLVWPLDESRQALVDLNEKCKAETARAWIAEKRARDCGQDGPCATPPGCQRHWEERNRELLAASPAPAVLPPDPGHYDVHGEPPSKFGEHERVCPAGWHASVLADYRSLRTAAEALAREKGEQRAGFERAYATLERERDALARRVEQLKAAHFESERQFAAKCDEVAAAEAERDELRAKLAGGEPVAWLHTNADGDELIFSRKVEPEQAPKKAGKVDTSWKATPLYASPAQREDAPAVEAGDERTRRHWAKLAAERASLDVDSIPRFAASLVSPKDKVIYAEHYEEFRTAALAEIALWKGRAGEKQ
jgi:hypothetical protein